MTPVWRFAKEFFAPMTAGARHALIFLVALGLALQAATLIIGTRLYDGLKTSVQTECGKERDVGDLAHAKLVLSPGTHKPSQVAVAFIADSRVAFYGLGCHGTLKRPSPSFEHWAEIYNITYR